MHVFEQWEDARVPVGNPHTRGEHANSTWKGPSQELNLEPLHCGANHHTTVQPYKKGILSKQDRAVGKMHDSQKHKVSFLYALLKERGYAYMHLTKTSTTGNLSKSLKRGTTHHRGWSKPLKLRPHWPKCKDD